MRAIVLLILIFCSATIYSQTKVRNIGDALQLGVPLSAFAYAEVSGDRKGSIQLLKSLAVQTSSTIILKRVFNRKRPNGQNYSFPSGHTSLAFVGSTFFWKRYGWKRGVPATVLATFVAFSRVYGDDPRHHVSDVFAGAGLGALSALIFTRRRVNHGNISVIGDTSFVGLKYSYSFR